MAFKPEPMQRTIIFSSKSHQKAIIETLHALRIAHFNDYTEVREGDLAEFRIGRPLEEAADANEKLVRLRAMIRQLGLEGHTPGTRFTVQDIEGRLGAAMFDVEQEVTNAAESRTRMTNALTRLEDEATRLEPYQSVPLRLEDYHGYESLAAFAGWTSDPVAAPLADAVPDHQIFTGEDGFFVLFVTAERAADASDVLYKHGYREHPLPQGEGGVAERLVTIERERKDVNERLARAETALEDLRKRHGDFLVAAEEHLTITVAKAEAPLSFATSENAFIIDAWIPERDVPKVEAALVRATNGNVHVETRRDGRSPMHGADAAFGGEAFHLHDEADHHEEDVRNQPPTLLRNPGPARNFQYFTQMFSTPNYREIDPTAVLALAFPLFFGFMIGDLGLGLVMALLGFLVYKKLAHIDGLRQLGFAIGVAGVIAAVFGAFAFTDAFGIHYGFTNSNLATLERAGLEPACTPEVYQAIGATTWSCLLAGQVWEVHPPLYKTYDIELMLLLSLGAAFVHLLIGLLFGIRNEWGHNTKHTVAKFGWLILFLGFFPAAFALIGPEAWTAMTGSILPGPGLEPSAAYMATLIGLVVGAVTLAWSEGIQGVLEIPSMFSNILSYLRLGAVAIAKGTMVAAFNELTLVNMILAGGATGAGAIGLIIVGFIALLVAQVVLFALGMLSSGIQAIRLNYVEFFTKFYKGGGDEFRPFGHERRFSITTSPSTGGGKL